MSRRRRRLLSSIYDLDDGFISSWKTDNAGTSDSDQVTIPVQSGGSYNCVVYWGDGTTDTITAYNDPAWTHTYADGAGTYVIRIVGDFTGFRFNNGGDKLKLTNISQWGRMRLGNDNGYFYGCSNLTITATDVLDMTGTTTMSSAFRACSSLTTVPSMDSWDMSAVTSLALMFYQATNFNQYIGSWNTSSVTSMQSTFNANPRFNQDISGWNTANVTTMLGTFASATDFNQDISGWNTAKVISMVSMFASATSFNQDISGWNTAAVTSMESMFYLATSFNQDISSWNTAAVTNMYRMFRGATAFDQDLSGWDVTSLAVGATTGGAEMFFGVTLSTANYDALLIGWAAQAVNSGVTFSGGNSTYSAGAATTARGVLTGTYTWSITDGGAA